MARSSEEIDAVAFECMNLLTVYYTYRELLRTFEPSSSTRFQLHRWWVSLRVLENDLVMRLCRLDDDSKSNHSLREALQSVRAKIAETDQIAINKQLKSYRQLINPIKTKVRNYYLAHLSKAAQAINDPKGGLEKPIEKAIEILDAVAGESKGYFLSVGSQEKKVNLRIELAE